MGRFEVLEYSEHVNLHMVAFEYSLRENSPVLIITDATAYKPSFNLLLRLRDRAFILLTKEYLTQLKQAINDFKSFILIGYGINSFEREFFAQVSKALDKTIVVFQRTAMKSQNIRSFK